MHRVLGIDIKEGEFLAFFFGHSSVMNLARKNKYLTLTVISRPCIQSLRGSPLQGFRECQGQMTTKTGAWSTKWTGRVGRGHPEPPEATGQANSWRRCPFDPGLAVRAGGLTPPGTSPCSPVQRAAGRRPPGRRRRAAVRAGQAAAPSCLPRPNPGGVRFLHG